MPINITMPALSPTMEEGNLAKWLVKEGDKVTSGDVIAEIETDKATMEVEAVDEGIIAKILVAEGSEGVKVNAVIAMLAEEGEDVDQISVNPPESALSEAAPSVAPSVTETNVQSAADDAKVAATPLARRVAGQENVNLENLQGTGARNKITLADVKGAAGGTPITTIAPASGSRVFASPLARVLAKDAGLELSLVAGSGPNGRIVQKDIEAAIASGSAKPTSIPAKPEPAVMASGMEDDAVLKLYDAEHYELKKHDTMRRIIAQRLTESTQSIPSYFLTVECELDQ